MIVVLSGWYFWLAFGAAIVAVVGYGWGYRGWGAPLPSFWQRRRQRHAAAGNTRRGHDFEAWGRGGDFVWSVLIFAALLVAAVFV